MDPADPQNEISIDEIVRHVRVGDKVDAQLFFKNEMRTSLRYVGAVPGKCLIFSPLASNKADVQMQAESGCAMIIRLLLEDDFGEIVAFRSHILSVSSFPSFLMFVEYPSAIQQRSLRRTRRIQTLLPAEISLLRADVSRADQRLSGQIVDLSPSGCGFRFPVGSSKSRVNKVDILLHIDVGQQSLELQGAIRNVRMTDTEGVLGIQFLSPEEQITEKLEAIFGDIFSRSA